MGARRTQYQIVGRYMAGKEVTAYHLQSIETGKAGRYSREQVAYLVGRDQITNCVGQIYQDKLLLRGKGMSLEDLPVQQEDGTLKKTDNIGKVRRGTSAADAMEQWMIVGTLKSGKNTVGYVVQNAGCGIKKVKRQQVIELARAGKIGNARVQMYQGRELLRGVNVNLDELPSENIGITPTNNNDKGADNSSMTQKNIDINSVGRRAIIISIDQFVTNGKPYLVNFNCKDTYHLTEFAKYIMTKTNQQFDCSGLDIIESNLGKDFYAVFDNGLYTLDKYKSLADEFRIKLVVLNNFDIIDENTGELLDDNDPNLKRMRQHIITKCKNLGINII